MKKFCLVMGVFMMASVICSVHTSAQSPVRVIVSATTAPIFLKPDTTITPLRLAKTGSILNLVANEGEWYRVEFQDPQWGRRVGYIEKRHVRVIAAPALQPVDLTVPESKASVAQTATAAKQPQPNEPESRPAPEQKRYSLADMFRDISKNMSESTAQREREERERAQRHVPFVSTPDLSGGTMGGVPNITTGGIMGGGGTYRISVRRIDSNIYVEGASKTIIETQLCLELASWQTNAILNWAGGYGNSWIYFPDSQSKCDVVALR